MPLQWERRSYAMLIGTNKVSNGPASANQGCSTTSQDSCYVQGTPHWNPPTFPIPPSLLAQNRSLKRIVPSNMQPKSDNAICVIGDETLTVYPLSWNDMLSAQRCLWQLKLKFESIVPHTICRMTSAVGVSLAKLHGQELLLLMINFKSRLSVMV